MALKTRKPINYTEIEEQAKAQFAGRSMRIADILAEHQASIDNHKDSLKAHKASIDSLSSVDTSAIGDRLGALESNITAQVTKLNVLESNITTQGTKLNVLESNITAQGTKLNVLESNITAQDIRLNILKVNSTEYAQDISLIDDILVDHALLLKGVMINVTAQQIATATLTSSNEASPSASPSPTSLPSCNKVVAVDAVQTYMESDKGGNACKPEQLHSNPICKGSYIDEDNNTFDYTCAYSAVTGGVLEILCCDYLAI